MTEEMAPSVGRFADGSVHSRTNMGVTDTVYVYETKSAPEARAWNMEYPSTTSHHCHYRRCPGCYDASRFPKFSCSHIW